MTKILKGVTKSKVTPFLVAEGGERMVKINGTEVDAAGKTIAEFLETTEYNPLRIAVERNGEIVPKAKYAETVLQDGDSVDVVNFVGGG